MSYEPPRIITRDEAGLEAARPGIPARPLELVHGLVVHHEGVAVDYASTTPEQVWRAIQRWHLYGNGWSDIAYNLGVWPDGTVLLGRDAGVRGGHTVAPGPTDWNMTTTSVCFIGLGDDEDAVTDDAWRSILWCWQLNMWVTGGRGSAFLTHHETGSPTHCAGDAIQDRMDHLRIFLAGMAA